MALIEPGGLQNACLTALRLEPLRQVHRVSNGGAAAATRKGNVPYPNRTYAYPQLKRVTVSNHHPSPLYT